MFIVVFRNRKRADIDADAYSVDAARMERLARTQLGFVSFKSHHADDGEVLALSEWEREAALGCRQVAHIEVQGVRATPTTRITRSMPATPPGRGASAGTDGAGAASAVTPFAALADRR
jgi:hypothetical protein